MADVHRILRISWFVATAEFRALQTFLVNSVIGARLVSKVVRPHLLNLVGASIGDSYIESNVEIHVPKNFAMGANGYINVGTLIDASATVSLADGVNLGHGVRVITSTHNLGSNEKRAGNNDARAIVMERGVWVGAGAIILPGVTIGSGTIIGAGSVVTSNCQPDSLYAGNPAKFIKKL